MSAWAYQCRPCEGGGEWWVARDQVDAMPAEVHILRLKVGADWRCATVDRGRPLAVEAMLLREAVASDALDCPDCAAESAGRAPQTAAAEPGADHSSAAQLQAAAITLQGQRLVVALVGLDLLGSPGEADMLISDLRARFGGVDVVLMAQDDSGAPQFHGESDLVGLLVDLPVDKMPWKAYPLR